MDQLSKISKNNYEWAAGEVGRWGGDSRVSRARAAGLRAIFKSHISKEIRTASSEIMNSFATLGRSSSLSRRSPHCKTSSTKNALPHIEN